MLWALLVLLVLLWCPGPQILWRLAVVFLLLSAIVYVVFIPVAHAQDLAEVPKTPEFAACLVQNNGMILVTKDPKLPNRDLPLGRIGKGQEASKVAQQAITSQTGYYVTIGPVFLNSEGRITFICTLGDKKAPGQMSIEWAFPNELMEELE